MTRSRSDPRGGNHRARAALFSLLAATAPVRLHADGLPVARTLDRYHDPVILETANFAALPDRLSSRLRLYRVQHGRAEPIPYQIDQRDALGQLNFPAAGVGPPARFDDDDEFLFMARDTGDRSDPAGLPPGRDATLEIEVTDPLTQTRGWVYAVHFPARAPVRSPVAYAHFDARTNQARAELYTMDYYAGRNFFTGMKIAPKASGSGENLLDRMKVRFQPSFSLLRVRWSPLFTEEDFSVEIDGIRNGPVRAVRRVQQRLSLGPLLPKGPAVTVYTYYYFSSFSTPSEVKIPWLALKSLRAFRFEGVNDFRASAGPLTYWDAARPEGIPYTGTGGFHPDASLDHRWWAAGGPAGTCLHVFLTPAVWAEWGIRRGTVFVDDASLADPSGLEAEPGSRAAGFSLLNLEQLQRPGAYQANLATFVLPRPYRPGDEKAPLAMLEQPLRVTVTPLP